MKDLEKTIRCALGHAQPDRSVTSYDYMILPYGRVNIYKVSTPTFGPVCVGINAQTDDVYLFNEKNERLSIMCLLGKVSDFGGRGCYMRPQLTNSASECTDPRCAATITHKHSPRDWYTSV